MARHEPEWFLHDHITSEIWIGGLCFPRGFFFLISFSLNFFRANEAKQMLITEPSLVVLFVTYFYSETQSQRTCWIFFNFVFFFLISTRSSVKTIVVSHACHQPTSSPCKNGKDYRLHFPWLFYMLVTNL